VGFVWLIEKYLFSRSKREKFQTRGGGVRALIFDLVFGSIHRTLAEPVCGENGSIIIGLDVMIVKDAYLNFALDLPKKAFASFPPMSFFIKKVDDFASLLLSRIPKKKKRCERNQSKKKQKIPLPHPLPKTRNDGA